MFFNKMRLKWKIFALLLGFCALLVIIIWVFQVVLLDTFYRQIKVWEIRQDATTIVNSFDSDRFDSIVSDIAENSETAIRIFKVVDGYPFIPQGFVARRLFEEYTWYISLANENNGEFYQYIEPQEEMPGYIRVQTGSTAPRALLYVRLAEANTGEQYVIIISAIVSPVSATVSTLNFQLYVVSGIMMILSVLLAIIIARRVSKPIEEISKSAQSLAKGNYDTKFSGKGFHEIVTLSETLNKAAYDLGQVEKLRRDLLANVSHDLRTPLALIYSYAEMMSDFPSEISSEQIKVIMDETTRLTSLVKIGRAHV